MAPCVRAMMTYLLALTALGCAPLARVSQSHLAPLRGADDSVALEKFTVRFPSGDPRLNAQLWDEIDEQSVPLALRQRLAANGLRAGVIGTHVPQALRELMESPPAGSPAQNDAKVDRETDKVNDPTANGDALAAIIDVSREPHVKRSVLHTRGGQKSLLIVAGEHEPLPLVHLFQRSEQGAVQGSSYSQAVGAFALTAHPQGDGRVQVDLLPELQHGEPKSDWIVENGAIRTQIGKPSKVFSDLAMSVTLAPGQILAVGCLPEKPGSLGYHLFTEQRTNKPLQQKVMLVRLARTPFDDRFAAAGGVAP